MNNQSDSIVQGVDHNLNNLCCIFSMECSTEVGAARSKIMCLNNNTEIALPSDCSTCK